MIIDSHCHLDDPKLAPDLDAIINRANDVGVKGILSVGARYEEFDDIIAITEKYKNVWATLGEHPWVADTPLAIDAIKKYVTHPKLVAIGECGLDFSGEGKGVYATQKKLFEPQIELAITHNLPLIIHSRDADKEMIDILKYYAPQGLRGVLHCYTSGLELAKVGLDLGFYLSASGIITFKKADAVRDVFKFAPLDRLLVETDGPYLAPEPNRGKICEPAFTVDTAKKLAEIKEISFEELANQTTQNFFKLFTKAKFKD